MIVTLEAIKIETPKTKQAPVSFVDWHPSPEVRIAAIVRAFENGDKVVRLMENDRGVIIFSRCTVKINHRYGEIRFLELGSDRWVSVLLQDVVADFANGIVYIDPRVDYQVVAPNVRG